MKILMLLAEAGAYEYNLKMGELLGKAVMILLVVVVIGSIIRSQTRKK